MLQDRKRIFGEYKIIGLRKSEVNDFLNEFNDNCNKLNYPFFFKWDDNKYYYVKFINEKIEFGEIIPDENYYEISYSLMEAI